LQCGGILAEVLEDAVAMIATHDVMLKVVDRIINVVAVQTQCVVNLPHHPVHHHGVSPECASVFFCLPLVPPCRFGGVSLVTYVEHTCRLVVSDELTESVNGTLIVARYLQVRDDDVVTVFEVASGHDLS
jgi:hypothetical protein